MGLFNSKKRKRTVVADIRDPLGLNRRVKEVTDRSEALVADLHVSAAALAKVLKAKKP